MLVRAAAAGLDIGSLQSTAGVGAYRFTAMLQRAQALAASVRGLGQALLSALEKRDAEALALLRQIQEESLLDAVAAVKKAQLDEAKQNLEAAQKAKALATARRDHYDRLLSADYLSEETKAGKQMTSAFVLDTIAASVYGVGAILAWTPDFEIFTPKVKVGGSTFHNAISQAGGALGATSGAIKTSSGRLTTAAGYERRKQDWKLQKRLADRRSISTRR